MREPTTFAAWLRARRQALDLTQEALAERVGCSGEMIRKLEAGRARPSQQLAALLVAGLAVPPPEQPTFVQWARGGPPPTPDLAPSAPASALPALPTGIVTFLYTDIEGSMARWEQHPAAMQPALGQHDALLRAAIAGQDGVVFHNAGDSFAAAFRTAHAALAAALAAQRALQAASWPKAIGPLRVRMAVHTGLAEERADGWHAEHTLNRLARLLAVAHGGQVLVSGVTRELVQEHLPAEVTLRDLGDHRLKDLIEALRVFQVVAPDLPADFPPLRTFDARPNNLPQQLTSFIGRERELAEVERLLGVIRLLTLTGAGGSGKTRLALQVAAHLLEHYPAGVWFVELAAVQDAALVAQTVAEVLRVREDPQRTIAETLADYLRDRHLLLVLDNCEHLVATVAELADNLLRTCPDLHILATSREALSIAGETTYRVPSLAVPDPQHLPPIASLTHYEAVRLFIDRALAVQPHFTVTNQNAPALAHICVRLDGIPLAIELAAARVRALPVEQIAARLDDRFRLLTGGSRTALPRHQTLRALIDWSYDLLTAPEQAVLRRLAVFAGGWMLEAAEAVCARDGIAADEILGTLTRLVDKSLVSYEALPEGTARYWLLETVRQYAHEKLGAADEWAASRERHLAFYLHLAEQAEPHLKAADQLLWFGRLETEHDNLRLALDWTVESQASEAGLRLAGALARFWQVWGYGNEGRRWLATALTIEPLELTPAWKAARAKALFEAGRLSVNRSHIEEALALYQELNDRHGVADTQRILGQVAFDEDRAKYVQLVEQSLVFYQEMSDIWSRGAALLFLGQVSTVEGDFEKAQLQIEQSLAHFRQVGDRLSQALSINALAVIALDCMNFAEARAYYEQALLLWNELGDRRGVGLALSNLGTVSIEEGDYVAAHVHLQQGVDMYRDLGEKFWVADSL
jgi:predicted ATPase/class 3 adenylate cyclase/DNA-binding XRE family transcriptional regulator